MNILKNNEMEILIEKIGWPGIIISGSKSGYRSHYPDNIVVFNANVVIDDIGKVWYGDIDITKSLPQLKECSKVIGKPLYIFHEMDYRFENEKLSIEEAKMKAHMYYIVDQEGLQTVTRK